MVFRALTDAGRGGGLQETHDEIARLREQYRFFHWHLEFPEVFDVPKAVRGIDPATGWAGGFDCVLGNPPWERIKLQEQEFFAQRDVTIATATNAAARKRLIAALKDDEDRRSLYEEFEAAKRQAEGESHFLRNGGRYPLTGRGDINTYAVFAEADRTLIGKRGRMGVIVPTGIATDATTQHFFKDLVQRGAIASLYDLETNPNLWSGIGHNRFKFSLLSLCGSAHREPVAKFAFFMHSTSELDDPGKVFSLTPEEITLLNPNTGTCPVFRSRRDAEITLGVYRRIPVLIKEGDRNGNRWGVSFMRMFDMANDSHLFHTRDVLECNGWTLTGNVFTKDNARMLPLCEAKMLHHYDHRWSTYTDDAAVRDLMLNEKQDAGSVVMSRYWVEEREVEDRLATRNWKRGWLVGWRDICRATDERTMISYVMPRFAVGHTSPIMFGDLQQDQAPLLGVLSSFVFDYLTRQKMGGTHVTYSVISQLPVVPPEMLSIHGPMITKRILELTYTTYDMASFALDLGDSRSPFRWDEYRRMVIRAELDALFFNLYGVSRDGLDYIMDTFRIVKRKDEAKYGTYRTKELILAEYDKMTAAGVGPTNPLIDGENYTSSLTPAPGQGPRHPALPTT